MTHKAKEIILLGTITKAADYNSKEIFHSLPVKPRNQIIEIQLDQDFWQILLLKNRRVKIIISEDQIPNTLD